MVRVERNKELEEIIRKYAVINAYQYGEASVAPVMGKVMAELPELKREAKEIAKIVEEIVNEINSLKKKELRALFEKYREEIETRKKEEGETKKLPSLPNAEMGKVVTRAAPNPNGPFHIGNARAYILSHEYARIYNGKFILRFEDTDPKIKRPEPIFYEWIKEDMKWLGLEWDEEYYQSDRLEIYYEIAEELIEKGKAYVCTCIPEKWRELRDRGEACPCRNLEIGEQLDRWKKMFSHYKEGEAVVRIKTDLNDPNPAIRDWAALRIIEGDHPRVGRKYRVWPLYNFSCAVDDYLMGVTHILRGQEHAVNERRQSYVYEYMGWEKPVAIHHGRLMIEGVVLSTSKIRNGINKGEYSGWDDPRLGTIRALRRRGITPQAIKELIISLGPKTSDVSVSWDNLAAINRKIVDPKANRYFFVPEPVLLRIRNGIPGKYYLRLHPDYPQRGSRVLEIPESGNGEVELYVPKDDMKSIPEGKIFRLKDLWNVKLIDKDELLSERVETEEMPKIKIQWLPLRESIKAIVVMGDASLIEGLIERNVLMEKEGEVVQLERFGFCRIDSASKDVVTLFFSHK